MNKRAFSLIEILISISLFSLILIFLYETLDMTTKSNQFYSKKLEMKQNKNHLKSIIFSDLINIKNTNTKYIAITDRRKNSILNFKTQNTYHNPFYNNITYLVTKNKNFVRIESKNKFDIKKLDDEFFKYTYIDILSTNVSKLKIKQEDKKFYFYIEYKDKSKSIFSF